MFNKLVGNDNVKQTLRRLIEKRRVPNSMLFAGDEGVGKLQFALELARSFICTDPKQSEACGVCSACTRIDTFVIPESSDKTKDEFKKVFFGGHSDVGKVVRYKRTILVDAIRDLERNANFLPYEAKARFFIVDDADKMNDEAANALLKTLEEPPPTTHIFLITSRPDSLLPTIRSRCQTIRFAPVAEDAIENYLIEDRAFSHDEAKLAARLARGSIGRAVSINVGKFRDQRERMLGALTHMVETGDRAALLQIAETMNDAKNKDAFEDNLDIVQSLAHDVWTLAVGGEQGRVINADLVDTLARISKGANAADLPSFIGEVDTMRENLIVNINRKIAVDALFVGMTA